MGEGFNIAEEYFDLPLRILGPSTRRLLSIHLDPPAVIPTPHGVLGDLSGLAELAGFEFCHIRYFETKQSRTFACLEEWGCRESGTVGNLLKNLTIMERFDCISEIQDSISRDIKSYVHRSETNTLKKINTEKKEKVVVKIENIKNTKAASETRNSEDTTPCPQEMYHSKETDSVATIDDSGFRSRSSCGESISLNITTLSEQNNNNVEVNKNEFLDIVNGDTMDKMSTRSQSPLPISRPITPIYEEDGFLTTDDRDGHLQRYSACICCADEDMALAKTIMNKYKIEQDTHFFLPQESLLSGTYEFETLAEVIETRCDSRVIVILSKHYVTSSACVFATQFVKTLDPAAKRRKIIPVLLDEEVQYPRVLRGISSIKARRLKYGNSFWNLMSSSLRLPQTVSEDNTLISNQIFTETNMNQLSEGTEYSEDKTAPKQKHAFEEPSGSIWRASDSGIASSCGTQSQSISEKDNTSSLSGTTSEQQSANSATGNSKKKNPGLRTLRRIMKSLNIIERKPKLQFTKRSHSTGETMESSPDKVYVEPRSHSTIVPPVMTLDTNRLDDSKDSTPKFNICHTESEATLKDFSDASSSVLQIKDSRNNITVGTGTDIFSNESPFDFTDSALANRVEGEGLPIHTGQNILSPNIDVSSPDSSFHKNNFNLAARQVSYENNMVSNTMSFDSTSLVSEITSSDNNSIKSSSRKTSLDNHSVASSFRQMYFGSNSRQASFENGSRQASFENGSRQSSFENGSRQTSFDGNSMVSIEDNMAADKQTNKPCSTEIDKELGPRNKSEVMFEIML